MGDIIHLRNVGIKPTSENFNITTARYEVIVTENTSIQSFVDIRIPLIKWKTPIADIDSKSDGSLISLQGKIIDVGDVISDYNNAGETIDKRYIKITDDKGNEVCHYINL